MEWLLKKFFQWFFGEFCCYHISHGVAADGFCLLMGKRGSFKTFFNIFSNFQLFVCLFSMFLLFFEFSCELGAISNCVLACIGKKLSQNGGIKFLLRVLGTRLDRRLLMKCAISVRPLGISTGKRKIWDCIGMFPIRWPYGSHAKTDGVGGFGTGTPSERTLTWNDSDLKK